MQTVFRGSCVRLRRLEKGYTLRGFAKEINISPSYLSDIELGKAQPTIAILHAIAQALECSISDLIQDDANPLEPVRDTSQ